MPAAGDDNGQRDLRQALFQSEPMSDIRPRALTDVSIPMILPPLFRHFARHTSPRNYMTRIATYTTKKTRDPPGPSIECITTGPKGIVVPKGSGHSTPPTWKVAGACPAL